MPHAYILLLSVRINNTRDSEKTKHNKQLEREIKKEEEEEKTKKKKNTEGKYIEYTRCDGKEKSVKFLQCDDVHAPYENNNKKKINKVNSGNRILDAHTFVCVYSGQLNPEFEHW